MAQVKEAYIKDSSREDKIAELFDIEVEDLDVIGWDVDGEYSNDGMLYGYFITVGQNAAPDELERLGIADNTMQNVDPWFFGDYDNNEDDWFLDDGESLKNNLENAPHLFAESSKNFNETADDIIELLKLPVPSGLKFNHYVMLHMHTVSAFEHFLYKSMVYLIANNEENLGRFLLTDKGMQNMKFKISDVFCEEDFKRFFREDEVLKLKSFEISEDLLGGQDFKSVALKRLDSLTFHNLDHIIPTYKNVLCYEFSQQDRDWLGKAIRKRHDCAHRAGYDKEGNKVDLSVEGITDLVNKLKGLVEKIDAKILYEEPI